MRTTEIISVMKKYVATAIKSLATAKSNLNATAAPTATDDSTKGYKEGSTWIFNGTTYTCVNSAESKAVWASSADIFYFDSWSALVAAVSVAGSTYTGKHATVANANGGPSSGATYTAPTALTNYIVDGGSATYKINTQGTNYSVACLARTITNPVVTSVMLLSSSKPTVPGYYIFTVNPTDGLPLGVALNDIAYFNGSAWSVWQKYAAANTVLVAGSTPGTQITWRKFQGTWMSTADEYNPDGKEYQTGKLYNGKPVYRKCTSGTAPTTASIVMSVLTMDAGGIVLIVQAVAKRSDSCWFTIAYNTTEMNFWVNSTGLLRLGLINTTGTHFGGAPYTAWVEYTKS